MTGKRLASSTGDQLAAELRRAAAFRSSLRGFLARTDDASTAAGLTSQRYDLLLMIKTGAAERSTVTELSERLSLRQTAATELVNRAVESGLVARDRSPDDGRVTLLRVTEEGEQRLLKAFLALRDERASLADAMGEVASAFRASVPRRKPRSRRSAV
jgi:DNA-binding MarR family transcriptional regulator